MASYPRSNRKRFEIVRNEYPVLKYTVYSYSNVTKRKYLEEFFSSKKKARQYVAEKKQNIKEREW
jgi:hypothetical protein